MTAPHMPMMNDEGLLECPFCGGMSAYKDYFGGKSMHTVTCDDCGCGTDECLLESAAISAWNTRNGHLWTKQDFADRAFEMQNSDSLEKK